MTKRSVFNVLLELMVEKVPPLVRLVMQQNGQQMELVVAKVILIHLTSPLILFKKDCATGCAECTDDKTCTKCKAGYETDDNGGCNPCSTGLYSSPDGTKCKNCPEGQWSDEHSSKCDSKLTFLDFQTNFYQ